MRTTRAPAVKYEVVLLEVATGRETTHRENDFDWLEFLWSEGNYGCDCNRALLFARAFGEPEPDDPPCGEGAYVVLKATLADGTVAYSEKRP